MSQSEKLGWRMLGAINVLIASGCQARGLLKYEDATAGRIGWAIVVPALWMYFAYRCWRNEMKS